MEYWNVLSIGLYQKSKCQIYDLKWQTKHLINRVDFYKHCFANILFNLASTDYFSKENYLLLRILNKKLV